MLEVRSWCCLRSYWVRSREANMCQCETLSGLSKYSNILDVVQGGRLSGRVGTNTYMWCVTMLARMRPEVGYSRSSNPWLERTRKSILGESEVGPSTCRGSLQMVDCAKELAPLLQIYLVTEALAGRHMAQACSQVVRLQGFILFTEQVLAVHILLTLTDKCIMAVKESIVSMRT